MAAALLLLPIMGAGCGDESTGGSDTLGVNNVTPMGSVGGLIVDAVTLKGIKDVTVSVLAGGKVYAATGKTDTVGSFAVEKVPTGPVIVLITPTAASNYLSVTLTGNIANAAGDFPLANAILTVGPIGLIKKATSTDAFRVQILGPDGAPKGNITATLNASVRYVDFNNGAPRSRGATLVEAKTGTSGVATFTGMPNFSSILSLVGNGVSDLVRVKVMPYKNSKGVFEFLGKEVTYNVTQLKKHVPTIILDNKAAPGTLAIEAATIAALMGQKGTRQLTSTKGPMYVAFNWPLNSTLTKVDLFDEFGNRPAKLPKVEINGNLMKINFEDLKAGAEYNITIKAYATVGKKLMSKSFGAPFFTPPTTPGAKVTASLKRKSTDNTHPDYRKIIVTFSEPIGTGVKGQSLSGSNAPVFFGYDLNGSGTTGDSAGERGYASSNTSLTNKEKTPPGSAGLSGFSTKWEFSLPNTSLQSAVAAGTPVDFSFSKVSLKVERASGQLVADITGLSVPTQ